MTDKEIEIITGLIDDYGKKYGVMPCWIRIVPASPSDGKISPAYVTTDGVICFSDEYLSALAGEQEDGQDPVGSDVAAAADEITKNYLDDFNGPAKTLYSREPCFDEEEMAYRIVCIVLHEMGHLVLLSRAKDAVIYKKCEDVFGKTAAKKAMGDVSKDEMKAFSKIVKAYDEAVASGDIYKVSALAADSPEEFFAESFSVYCLDGKGETLPEVAVMAVEEFLSCPQKYYRYEEE